MNKCKGCAVYIEENTSCAFRLHKHRAIKDCPCRECLIKMMCRDPCQLYVDRLSAQVDKLWIRRRSKNGKMLDNKD